MVNNIRCTAKYIVILQPWRVRGNNCYQESTVVYLERYCLSKEIFFLCVIGSIYHCKNCSVKVTLFGLIIVSDTMMMPQ